MRNKQVVMGAVLSYGAIIFNIIAGLLYTPWMIHTVGDDQYALYTLAISVINIFLMDFGIGSAVSRFLSNYYARGEYDQANRFMGIVYKVYLVIAVIIAVCLFIFYFLLDGIYSNLTLDELLVFKHLFIIVASYSVLSFPFSTFGSVLMANERFIEIKACDFGQKILEVVLVVVALLFGSGVYALVLMKALSNLLFVFIKYCFVCCKTTTKAAFFCSDKGLAKELFDFSIWSTVMTLAQRCVFNIAPTVIAALIGSIEVTLFSLAASLEGYVYTFANAVNGMFLPRISRILLNEDAGNCLTNLMSQIGKFHIYTIGLLYIGFLCLGQRFVGLWMGEGYDVVYACALCLIFPSLIDLPQQVARTALLAEDYVKEQALVYVAMAVTNLLLFFVLIPRLGVIGAAVSVCVAYLVRTIASNVLYHKVLPLDLGMYFKRVYVRWIPVALLSTIFGIVFCRYISIRQGWLTLFIQVALLTIVYAVLTIAIGLNKEERKNVIAIFKR